MKAIIAAITTAIAFAQTTDSTSEATAASQADPAPLEDETTANQVAAFSADGVTMSTVWGEVLDTEVGDAGSSDSVRLYVTFTTGGAQWDDDAYIQNYVSIEDPDARGNYMTATCSAAYTRDQPYATDVTVSNFMGTDSFTVASTGDFGV